MNSIPYYINNPSNSLEPSPTAEILKEGDALSFHQSLNDYKPTPLHELKNLAAKFGVGNIYIKDESYRFGLNAFKGLGASYAIHKILEKNPKITTFCTATDGNHGRAVAWSSKLAEKGSRIFVPRDTTMYRIEAIEAEGAIVEQINGNYEETCAHAKMMAEGNRWTLVQDTASEDYEDIPAYIMAGYITHFQEMENSLHTLPDPQIDVVFLQCGVGSWPAAAAWYYLNRYGEKKPKIVLVEPTEAAGLLTSLKEGKRTSPTGTFQTMMAGLNCGIPSSTAWEILKDTADAAIAIEDSFTVQAIRQLNKPLAQDPKIISGESGAAGVAGFIAVMTDPRFAELKDHLNLNRESRILFYSTEGATDPGNFQKIIIGDPDV